MIDLSPACVMSVSTVHVLFCKQWQVCHLKKQSWLQSPHFNLPLYKIKFADDMAEVGLITDGDETAYREEVRDLAVWCQNNNLSLNISKTKELINDFMTMRRVYAPIHSNGAVVERVESFKFLGVHITKDLNMVHTHDSASSSSGRFVMGPRMLKKFYSCTIENISTGCITAWYGKCTILDRKALQRVVRMAQYISGV